LRLALHPPRAIDVATVCKLAMVTTRFSDASLSFCLQIYERLAVQGNRRDSLMKRLAGRLIYSSSCCHHEERGSHVGVLT